MCAGFASTGQSSSEGPGDSHMGGLPDLPNSFEWPKNSSGRSLDFILQINLEHVRGSCPTDFLPPAGLLTFFYDIDSQPWGFDPKHSSGRAVLFHPDPTGLQRYSTPVDVTVRPATTLQFWPALSVPHAESRAGQRLIAELASYENGAPNLSALTELSEELFRMHAPNRNTPWNQVAGHPYIIQGDMQLEAQLVSHGLYCGNASGYNDPRAAALEDSCEGWKLLLQLDSDEDTGLVWGDSGMVYVWIRESDLRQRDFCHTWVGLQCY